MTFSLTTNRIQRKKIKNFDTVADQINKLKDKNDYIILDNDPPIHHAVFIQAMLIKKDQYCLEVRLEHEADFSQHGIQVTQTECLNIFEQYYKGNLPDIKQWNDITNSIKQYYFDTEIELSPERVHPSFSNFFKADFYYSTTDHYTPFGNDPGFDAMMGTEEFLKKDDSNCFYLIQLINEMMINIHTWENENHDNLHLVVYNHQVTIAIGFTNLKVNGYIMNDVKDRTLSSLTILDQLQGHENYKMMLSDLIKVEAATYPG